MMLAAVAFNASGDLSLKGANGTPTSWRRSAEPAQPSSTQVKLQPVADATPSSQLPSLNGGTGCKAVTLSRLERALRESCVYRFLDPDCINCQHTTSACSTGRRNMRSQGLVVIGVHTRNTREKAVIIGENASQ